jgi:hypothetical protein
LQRGSARDPACLRWQHASSQTQDEVRIVNLGGCESASIASTSAVVGDVSGVLGRELEFL